MKQLLFKLVFILIPAIAICQDSNECEKINSYTHLQVLDGIIVSLEKGDSHYICPGTQTKLSELQITDKDNILRIEKVNGIKYSSTPRVNVSFKNLNHIEGYAKSEIYCKDTISSDKLEVVLKSGTMFYGNFSTNYIEAEIAEASLLKAEGFAKYQKIYVSSKSTFSGFELLGKTGDIKVTTGGIAKVFIADSMRIKATTGGYLTYKGTPMLETKGLFGGTVVTYSE
jgi:hypothetical protein